MTTPTTFNEVMRSFRSASRQYGIDSMAAWDVAKYLGIGYDGDGNLEHGGLFYVAENWREPYGSADAVSVMADDGHVYIQTGQVHRSDVSQALECCGYDVHDSANVDFSDAMEVSACYHYAGIESSYDDANVACPIIERNGVEYFVHDGRAIAMDCLQGYVVRRFVSHILPID